MRFTIEDLQVTIDLENSIRVSIPMDFDGEQPRHFGATPASAQPMQIDSFIGNVSQGGSCNVFELQLNPHCNGTHTEGAGHILQEIIPINEILQQTFFPATLITVEPQPALSTEDTYHPQLEEGDRVITRDILNEALKDASIPFLQGLVIRTLPNDSSKCTRNYLKHPAPFFTCEAIQYLNGLGVEHLLVDIPSVDRMFDEGLLTIHHLFWNIPPGSSRPAEESWLQKTITEMIFVRNDIPDGHYICQIQIPDFQLDAAPSRVQFYPIL
ncbi:MAG: cyclase family protein [Calditrichaeota bacterium]|nr:MAG: cyclase family protein [Calditrichota bacterium]